MDIQKLNDELTAASAALSSLSVGIPIALAAYNILKTIWTRTNPGKTEADYLAYLQTASQANIDETAALLKADGYVEDPPGTWRKA